MVAGGKPARVLSLYPRAETECYRPQMRLPLACTALLLTACPSSPKPSAPKPSEAKAAPVDAKKVTVNAAAMQAAANALNEAKPASAKPTDPKKADAPKDDGKRATVSTEVKFSLHEMLGKSPAEIQPRLGDPTGKGIARESCVRFLPERTWFECKYAMQRYVDPTSTYDAITVTYEDGVSTGLAFEGIPGEGDFDPKAALAHVGVTLVGEPKESTPADNVTLWSWFNNAARLVVHDQQYRVEVSSVGGTWESSKIEFFLNHPLTDAQKAKVRAPSPGG